MTIMVQRILRKLEYSNHYITIDDIVYVEWFPRL